MHRLRIAILGAAAALTLGTASAFAMQEGASGTDNDAHGDAVASAARTTCPHGPNGVHGACVSAVASTEGQENEDGAQAAAVKACKAADASEDASEHATTSPNHGDKAARKAAKAAEHTEDKAEHQTFAACVSGHAATGS